MADLKRVNSRAVDLAQPLAVERGGMLYALGDEGANRVCAVLNRAGTAVDLTGHSVAGYFVRADGVTVEIAGAVDGSTAYVDLPAACTNVEGVCTLAIVVTGTSVAATVRILEGEVRRTRTDATSSGGTVYPGGAELVSMIAAKVDEPTAEGTSGQVLTTDGAGGRSWTTPSSEAPSQLDVDGTVYTLRVGTEGAAGYITLVTE